MAAPSIIRHSLPTRLLHWVNAVCVIVVLMSGLNIFNADPSFYWGEHGAYPDKALWTVAGGHGIPGWATLPSRRDLATGRLLHFFFAWVLVFSSLVYLSISLIGGHVRRDLLPSRSQIAPRHILHDLGNHLRLRFPTGEEARHYNVLQKLAYLGVIFVLAPLILATGLTMSPGFDAACPWLLTLFGGRQSARTLHFAAAMLVVLFLVVHLAMVVLAGPINEIRSMITGRYVLPPAKPGRAEP
jgi:thiosulfate reductase cytochrome b subunit